MLVYRRRVARLYIFPSERARLGRRELRPFILPFQSDVPADLAQVGSGAVFGAFGSTKKDCNTTDGSSGVGSGIRFT